MSGLLIATSLSQGIAIPGSDDLASFDWYWSGIFVIVIVVVCLFVECLLMFISQVDWY